MRFVARSTIELGLSPPEAGAGGEGGGATTAGGEGGGEGGGAGLCTSVVTRTVRTSPCCVVTRVRVRSTMRLSPPPRVSAKARIPPARAPRASRPTRNGQRL